MLSFDPDRAPVEPRPAATIVVVRPGQTGIELFCVRRTTRQQFLGGAVVFPGGKLDETDRDEVWQRLTNGIGERCEQLVEDVEDARAFLVAALRELLEEAAISPALDANGGSLLDDEAAQALRAELEAGARLADLLAARGARLDTAGLSALARWVTPTAEARRYDTRFYLLGLPAGQHGLHDARETTESFWAAPRDVLDRWERGEIFLAPPTSRTIELLLSCRSVEDAFEVARRQSLAPLLPHFTQDADEHPVLALPGDPLYPKSLPAPSDESAPTRFVLHDGRFVGRRVTA